MKELQKYYATTSELYRTVCSSGDVCTAIYIAAEADAAFAEMDQHHKQIVEILETRIANMREQSAFIDKQHAEMVEMLKREHAEEVERLKAGQRQIEMIRDWNDAHFKAIEKQAERYEKLRKLNVYQFRNLYVSNISGEGRFDDLVDQLPASGEASADEQARRVE